MANPIAFKPAPVDPKHELQRRITAAPVEHGEALLVAWDVLDTAHRQGILDTLHGLLGAKDTIAGKLSEYAKLPEGINGIRNLLALAKIAATGRCGLPELLGKRSRHGRIPASEGDQTTKPVADCQAGNERGWAARLVVPDAAANRRWARAQEVGQPT